MNRDFDNYDPTAELSRAIKRVEEGTGEGRKHVTPALRALIDVLRWKSSDPSRA
jgi:hypothetical protein